MGTDGAYISFTYARSLVRGDGHTWSGDHVEALMTPSATGFFVTDSNRFYFAQQCGSYVIEDGLRHVCATPVRLECTVVDYTVEVHDVDIGRMERGCAVRASEVAP